MLEIGDTYSQTFTFADGTGTKTDPSPLTFVITLPDGSTASPTVIHVSTGVYQIAYTIAQAGQHLVNMTGTVGAYPIAESDVFNAVTANPGQIVSLADARLAVGLPSGNTSQDEALRTVILGATPIMEDLIGPIIATTRTGTYDGGNPQIALVHAPILSITSVIESYGVTYQRTLTLQDPFSAGGADAFGYTVDLGSGILTRRAAGVAISFAAGVRNIQVIYVSGRVLAGNQILAARRLIRHLWQTEQQGFRPAFGAPDTSMANTPSGFAVPRAVIEILGSSTRPPGVG